MVIGFTLASPCAAFAIGVHPEVHLLQEQRDFPDHVAKQIITEAAQLLDRSFADLWEEYQQDVLTIEEANGAYRLILPGGGILEIVWEDSM